MKPGNDMPWGFASSVTVKLPPSSWASTPRRVESDSAANTRSSWDSSLLTIWFSINEHQHLVKHRLSDAPPGWESGPLFEPSAFLGKELDKKFGDGPGR